MNSLYFDNCIKYEEYIRKRYAGTNISDLLFANNLRREDIYGKYGPMFNFNELVQVDDLIVVYPYEQDKYIVYYHPDFEKLRKLFKHPNFVPAVHGHEKTVEIINDLRCDLQVLKNEIFNFLRERDEILSFKSIDKISSLSVEENKELQKVFAIIEKTFPINKVTVNDYFFEPKFQKFEKRLTYTYFCTYKIFSDFLRNYYFSDTEFYNNAYLLEENKTNKKELEEELKNTKDLVQQLGIQYEIDKCQLYIETMENRLNRINESSVFNKENLMSIYLNLESLVEKEKAIEELILKIRDGKLSKLNVSEDGVVKVV